MSKKYSDIEICYQQRSRKNGRFWSRLGGQPPLAGLKILDLGCGHGSLSVDMALRGAGMVTGIDINRCRIDFAIKNTQLRFPQLSHNLEFKCCDLRELPRNYTGYDAIVSYAVFEHVLDLEAVIKEITTRLKTGGKVFIGFGPLYNSPFGAHSRINRKLLLNIPWAHLFVPESLLVKMVNKKNGIKIKNIQDLGLNKFSLKQYERLLFNSGLKIVYYKVNAGNSLLSELFSFMRRISLFKEFFSYNIYCILEKA